MRLALLVSTATLALAACAAEPRLPVAVAPPPPPLEEAPSGTAAQPATPLAHVGEHITAAVADEHRPADDRARDPQRKPADMLSFAGIVPGQRVVDLIPGGGYFTRLFAKAVGADGKVYASAPPPPPGANGPSPLAALAADPAYANVTVVPLAGPFAMPEPVDVIFTAQNYHDLHLARLKLDVPAMNKAFFDALKPGGVLVIVDHSALPGTGLDVPDVLHRIDENIVVREVTAAGFVLDGSSQVLRNPEDPRTTGVFDPSIRGKTDQFVLRFRKP